MFKSSSCYSSMWRLLSGTQLFSQWWFSDSGPFHLVDPLFPGASVYYVSHHRMEQKKTDKVTLLIDCFVLEMTNATCHLYLTKMLCRCKRIWAIKTLLWQLLIKSNSILKKRKKNFCSIISHSFHPGIQGLFNDFSSLIKGMVGAQAGN